MWNKLLKCCVNVYKTWPRETASAFIANMHLQCTHNSNFYWRNGSATNGNTLEFATGSIVVGSLKHFKRDLFYSRCYFVFSGSVAAIKKTFITKTTPNNKHTTWVGVIIAIAIRDTRQTLYTLQHTTIRNTGQTIKPPANRNTRFTLQHTAIRNIRFTLNHTSLCNTTLHCTTYRSM